MSRRSKSFSSFFSAHGKLKCVHNCDQNNAIKPDFFSCLEIHFSDSYYDVSWHERKLGIPSLFLKGQTIKEAGQLLLGTR